MTEILRIALQVLRTGYRTVVPFFWHFGLPSRQSHEMLPLILPIIYQKNPESYFQTLASAVLEEQQLKFIFRINGLECWCRASTTFLQFSFFLWRFITKQYTSLSISEKRGKRITTIAANKHRRLFENLNEGYVAHA